MPFDCITVPSIVSNQDSEFAKMNIVNVMNYGAKGDGVTNDFLAIQNAVNAAANKVLYFPPGTYLITDSLTIGSNVKVEMANGAKIKPTFGKVLTINGSLSAGLYQVFDDFSGVYNPSTGIDDGLFNGVGGWTVGTGWTISGGVASHATGNTGQLTYSACSGIAGRTYLIKYTIGGTPGGNITARIGGVSGSARNTAGTYYDLITATGTGSLAFVPASGFDGTIDNVEVYMLGTNTLGINSISEAIVNWWGVNSASADNTSAFMKAVYGTPDYGILNVPKSNTAYTVSSAITITKPISIVGNKSEISVPSARTWCFGIFSSNVRISSFIITGLQRDSVIANEHGIYASGVDNGANNPPTYINNLIVEDCEISNFGYSGIRVDRAKNVKIRNNYIYDIAYAGILALCVDNSEISGNIVKDIYKSGYVKDDDAYGIAVTTWNNSDTVRYPRSSHVLVTNNIIDNVPSYEGLDTHGGDGIIFSENIVLTCYRAIALTVSTAYSPKNCVISGNKIYTDAGPNNSENGIDVYGRSSEYALNNTVIGNVVVGFGETADIGKGCIRLEYTQNTTVASNTLQNACNQAIALRPYNYGFSIIGNSITDTWSNTRTDPSCIRVLGNNHGVIEGNSFRRYDHRICYSPITFTGSGLNDMTVGGYKTSSSQRSFVVEIDGVGSPDTFRWSKDGGTTWDASGVSITGSDQALTEGVTIRFGATTGHTLGNRWSFNGYSAMQFGLLASSDATIDVSATNNSGNPAQLTSQGTFNAIRFKNDRHSELALGSVPSNGTFSVGDRVHRLSPVAGGFLGWVCTTAGTPGTWHPFGALISVLAGGNRSGTWSLDMTTGTVITCTATGDLTINASGSVATGERRTFIITNDASSNRTVTFGTNFKPSGTLVGTINKIATIEFVYNGTHWCEVSRVTGL